MVKQESSPEVQKLRNNDNSKNKLSLKLMTMKINDFPLIDLYITPNMILFLPSLSYFFLLTFSLHCIATKPLMHCFVDVDCHSSLSHTIVEQAFPHCLVFFSPSLCRSSPLHPSSLFHSVGTELPLPLIYCTFPFLPHVHFPISQLSL